MRYFLIVTGLLTLSCMLTSGCASLDSQAALPEVPPNQQIEPQSSVDQSLTVHDTLSTEDAPPAMAIGSRAVVDPPAANRYHVIQRGDTLWSIARRTYGSGQKYRNIAEANPGILARRLYVGQRLVLP